MIQLEIERAAGGRKPFPRTGRVPRRAASIIAIRRIMSRSECTFVGMHLRLRDGSLASEHVDAQHIRAVDFQHMSPEKSDVIHGTLDLMVLKTLDAMGPLHGYAIARRIEQISSDQLAINQGTLYPALLKLQQHG